MASNKIGILLAMNEELQQINLLTSDVYIVNDDYHSISTKYYKNLELIIIVSQIGKVAAADATSVLLNQYQCEYIINVGYCGGVNLDVGDVIISNQVAYHDADVTAFGYHLGQMPLQPRIFISKDYNNQELLISKLQDIYNVKHGLISSSDSFVNNGKQIAKIQEIYPDLIGVEMEAVSVGQLCHCYKKPFILLKIVSDNSDRDAKIEFQQAIDAKENIASNIGVILQEILDYIITNYS